MTSRVIRKDSVYCNSQIRDLLQSLFAAEFICRTVVSRNGSWELAILAQQLAQPTALLFDELANHNVGPGPAEL